MGYSGSFDRRGQFETPDTVVSKEKRATLTGRVAIFCFSSAGELDVMLPVLRISGVEKYRVVTFKNQIFERVQKDTIYRRMLGGRIEDRTVSPLSGIKPLRWAQFLVNALRTIWAYRHFDLFCFEYGNSGREKNILVLLLLAMGRGRKVIYYPHGHAVTPSSHYERNQWPLITRWSSRFGSKIIKIDGIAPDDGFLPISYPILNPLWKEALAVTVEQLYSNHVVILSRDAHPSYLLEANRTQMISDAIEVFTKYFPSSLIVIKAHPREVWGSGEIELNASVTYENTYSVVKGAKLVVSFWTSAFFQCLAVGAPVVEFHLPHAEFFKHYPSGSLNRLFIPSFTSKQALKQYVQSRF